MAKIELDKYYTPPELAKYCIDKTFEIIGEENISEIIEPSAGNGVFSEQIPAHFAYDIEPEHENIIKQDYLKLDINYLWGRLIIGNPPYGRCLSLAQKFYKKSVELGDYISFILPISQLNNTQSMYEFDLIYSEDLEKNTYTDRTLHCCLNIYKRPNSGELNKKTLNKLKDVTIVRQDSKKYNSIDKYDFLMSCFGASAGKLINTYDSKEYCGMYKIIINKKVLKDRINDILNNVDWQVRLKFIAQPKIQQFHIIELLKEQIPEIE
jgi:hypothetical protein